ncbi:MAG: hypothetical protein ACTSYL_03300 [Candidatus Thorarchaeota archaeon]
MREVTTIRLERSVVKALKELKEYPRQTYNELMQQLIQLARNVGTIYHHDTIFRGIQQSKMRELWDNKYDEIWNDA